MFESTEASPLNSPADSLAALPDDERPRLRRCRTSSSLASSLFSSSSKITLDLPTKTVPSIYLTVRSNSAFGAFSPTPDAHAALRFFATPTRKQRPTLIMPVPERAHTIPSISRTAPSISDRAPPSPASAPLLDFDTDYAKRKAPHDSTPPSLASLERRSRLCANRVFCATCRTSGTSFPACPRCGAAWCSRACRLPNGVRHACRAASPAASPAPRARSRSRTGISSPPVAISPSTPVPIPITSPR
ncbi:hypothetical protein B0H19DRAFT_1059270 [Mycena capillaripes]|nr:hypothetical protein B0H19DRAFT_1059270 [Mycena capillaripes]